MVCERRRLQVRDLIKAVEKDGWVLDRTRDDHRRYVHPARPAAGTITIPGHLGDNLSAGTLTEESGAEEMRYAVVFEKAPHSWAAYVPDLPGCVTTGRSIEETRRLIAEAIEFHIEGMRRRGEPIPQPTTVAETIEIAAA